MNKTRFKAMLLWLCFTPFLCPAQKPLSVGDTLPPELWHLPLQVVNHPEGKETITLADYKDKLIILDFWATWCGPCVKNLSALDSLQKVLPDHFYAFPTSYEDKKKIQSVLTKKNIGLHSNYSDTTLRLYFPHKSIPHQIWIKNNYVVAIADHTYLSKQNILNIDALAKKFRTKTDPPFNKFSTIFELQAFRQNDKFLHSTLTTFTYGYGGIGNGKTDSINSLYQLNQSIITLYASALVIPNNKIFIETPRLNEIINRDNNEANRYCYQLLASPSIPYEQIRLKAAHDLNTFFRLKLILVEREVPCYVLRELTKKIGKTKYVEHKLKYDSRRLTNLLNYHTVWNKNMPIFLDETNLPIEVGFEYPNKIYELRHDLDKLNDYLNQYQLEVVRSTRKLEIYVLQDEKKYTI